MNFIEIFACVVLGLYFGVLYPYMFLRAWITRNEPCRFVGCLCKSWTCSRCGRKWEIEGINWFHNEDPLRKIALEHMQRCW